MSNLSEEIGRIINQLEDAIEEQDWTIVQTMIDELDEIYNPLDRQENGYNEEYE